MSGGLYDKFPAHPAAVDLDSLINEVWSDFFFFLLCATHSLESETEINRHPTTDTNVN